MTWREGGRLSGVGLLQRPCPRPETGVELDRRLAGIADCALDLFEIPRGEIVALLQIAALGSSIAGRVGRDHVELRGQLLHERGQLTLTPADCLQSIDQRRTFAVGLLEETLESQSEA